LIYLAFSFMLHMQFLVNPELQLKRFVLEDAGVFYNVIQKNRTHLRTALPWVDRIQQIAHAEAYLLQCLDAVHNQTGFTLGMMHNDTLIGSVSVFDWLHEVRKAQIGFWLDKDYERKGYITTTLKVLIPYLFEQLKLNKIEMQHYTLNERSAQVASRLGFKIEGVMRQHFMHNGSLVDVVLQGLLQSDWYKQS
jgi:ribosomal-protein-serine acetyltransferase